MTNSRPPFLPSREDILAFIAREREGYGKFEHGKIGKREIAKAFGIKGEDRPFLKAMLKELEAEGALQRRGTRLRKSAVLAPVFVADIVSVDSHGDLVARPADWNEAEGAIPTVHVLAPRHHRRGEAVAGLGDRVLLRLESGDVPFTARTLKILPKAQNRILGVFRANKDGHGGRLIPVEKKGQPRELIISETHRNEAQDGDLVSVELLREGRLGLTGAKVRERLGSMASEKALSQIAIYTHNIRDVFSPSVLREAEAAKPVSLRGREDWRDVALVTIDPADAKDHDDAVFAESDSNPDNAGGYIITVAIADVAAYVTPGSAMDQEALLRGNSVYFPDRVVPMLPERISNDLCSLRAGENRPALAVRMVINAEGRKLSHSFHRILMRSAAKLSYQQAQAAVDGQGGDVSQALLTEVLQPLYGAYGVLVKARRTRGPLDLDLPERKLLLNEDGTLNRVLTPPRLDSHRLIEEFMILANVAAAETLELKKQNLIYRVHEEPALEKLRALSDFLASLNIKLVKGQVLRPAHFNSILEQVRGTQNETLVNEVVLRSQAQAVYSPDNQGHFGLNLVRYAHFTSPIRRYADLIVHRALIRALGLGEDGLPDMSLAQMRDVAEKISSAERRAMLAERDTSDRLIASFLAERIGAEFSGRISGVTKAGLFVKLAETGADGFVPASTLGNDFFRYEEALHALIGNRSGETYRLGDSVQVKLAEAAPFAGALRFEMLSDGSTGGNRMALGTRKSKSLLHRDNKPASHKRPLPSKKSRRNSK